MRFLGQLRGLDALFELGKIVLAVLVAEFLLNGLHLLIQIIFALGLLHLPLDTRADALFDLQHRDFAFHQRQALFEPLGDRGHFQHGLAVGDLDRRDAKPPCRPACR